MVVAGDAQPGADQLGGARSRLDVHVDSAEYARGRLVALVAGDVGQVLVQRAAERHVEYLQPAADGEQRDVTLQRGPRQRDLPLVTRGARR